MSVHTPGLATTQVLDTAAAVLAKDPAASLGQIAVSAGMGRTTLHKQFPTRHDLLVAVASRALDLGEAVVAAAPADPEPLRRMITDLLPYGAYLTVLMAQPEVFADDAILSRTDALAAPIAAIVAGAGAGAGAGAAAGAGADAGAGAGASAGAAASAVRPGVPEWWLVRSLHALLFTAWDLVQEGWLAPRDAPDLVLSTFTGGVLTR